MRILTVFSRFAWLSLFLHGLAIADTTNTAVVRPFTKDDGSLASRIEIKAVDSVNKTSPITYRSPTVRELKDLLKFNPEIKSALKAAFETDQDPASLLSTFDDSEQLSIDYKVPTLAKIAAAINQHVFGGTADSGATVETASLGSPSVDDVLKGLRPEEAKHIDKKRLEEILKRKATDMKGDSVKSADALALYDALAVVLSDTRCGFKRTKSKQLFLSKGIDFTEPPPVDLDANTNDIGGGSLTFWFKDSNKDPVDLGWDANHFTKMSPKDYLYGHPTGPSNGHVGLYKQLAAKKLCGLDSSSNGPSAAESGSKGEGSKAKTHGVEIK